MPTERECDQFLVDRAKAGCRKSFDMLVVKYQRRLMRFMSRMVRDQVEAEDLVQESFIKAYRALKYFRGDSAFYTWLYRIAINTAANFLIIRNRRGLTITHSDTPETETFLDAPGLRDMETPDKVLENKQLTLAINAALDNMQVDLRTSIVLRELEGLSYEEISKIMKCPVGTTRSRIFRAREIIIEKITPLLDPSRTGRF